MGIVVSSILYILIGGAFAAYMTDDGDDLDDMVLMLIWPILFLGLAVYGCFQLLGFIPRLFRSWMPR